MKKIAIIGSGLSGLGVAYYLRQYLPEVKISLFDKDGLGGKTSKIASGLLHPYPGKHARKAFVAHEAFEETTALLHEAQKYSDEMIADFSPIEKFTSDDNHFLDEYPDVEKLGDRHYLIKAAATIYPSRYLKALFNSLGEAEIIEKKATVEELEEFDHIVVAAGPGSLDLGLSLPKLNVNKGQILSAKKSIERGILCGGYIAKSEKQGEIYVGSTYEHHFIDDQPDINYAARMLRPRIAPFFPEFDSLYFHDCKVGFRVSSPHHNHPLIQKQNDRLSVFTGLGSRGLLYHALYGKKLAKAIAFGNSERL